MKTGIISRLRSGGITLAEKLRELSAVLDDAHESTLGE